MSVAALVFPIGSASADSPSITTNGPGSCLFKLQNTNYNWGHGHAVGTSGTPCSLRIQQRRFDGNGGGQPIYSYGTPVTTTVNSGASGGWNTGDMYFGDNIHQLQVCGWTNVNPTVRCTGWYGV